ncbi:hypothetical protein J4457_01000 [Candidatus Woesearchaeota archaeon]|nr:hypothetical protein [Candidatus Woesearchaeota archaeon]
MKAEILDKLSTFITAAFGFVAGLAWNDAMKNFFEHSPLEIAGPWVYAISVTIIAVFVTIWIGKVVEKAKAIEVKIPFNFGNNKKVKKVKK